MDKSHVSDEWLMGATLGAYLVVALAINFWASAFLHSWCANFMEPSPRFGDNLVLLISGLVVVALDWAQSKLADSRPALIDRRFLRVALWMNLIGILGFILALGSKYDGEDPGTFWAIMTVIGLVFLPLGLLLSLANLTWASIRWMKVAR